MRGKILLIEDDVEFSNLTRMWLKNAGYDVFTAQDGVEGMRRVYSSRPNLVLLDANIPKMDGWETCRRIRDISDIPVVMLTGKEKSEDAIVRGLDYGADDYLIKPVGNQELVARVRAILRRAELPSTRDKAEDITYSDDFLTVDVAQRKIIVNGERVKLTPTEFRLFTLLVENAGRVLTHKQLLENVWGWEYVDDLDHVRIYIWHLRQKIEPDPAQPRYVITEPGVGYYFQKANRNHS